MAHYMSGDDDFPSSASREHIFECDTYGCGETYQAGGSFKEAWAEAKEAGWRCFKDEDEWVHRCPRHVRRPG